MSPARSLPGLPGAAAGGGGRGQTPAPRAPVPPSCGAGVAGDAPQKAYLQGISLVRGSGGSRGAHRTLHPPPGSEDDLGDPPCPLTMLAPRIPGRAAVPSSVLNLPSPGLEPDPDRQAGDALGDTRALAAEAEGKPGLTHPCARAPELGPAPGCGGREPAPPPSDLCPSPAPGCCRPGTPVAAPRVMATWLSAPPPARVQQLRRP